MLNFLQILTALLISVAMAMALAHALEFPGKMRLTKEAYFATQSIYYPGFTVGGGKSEARSQNTASLSPPPSPLVRRGSRAASSPPPP